jgi:hypothetical protein
MSSKFDMWVDNDVELIPDIEKILPVAIRYCGGHFENGDR